MPASNEEFIKKAFEAGLTEDQVRAAVAERNQKTATSSAPQPTQQGPDTQWGDVWGNIIPSAGQFFDDVANAVTHPVDTGKGILALNKGTMNKVNDTVGFPVTDAISTIPGLNINALSQLASLLGISDEQANQSTDAVVDLYMNRYGSPGQAKSTIINDPVGFLADLSTVLDGVGLVGKGKVANIASKVAIATDPIAGPISASSKLVKGTTKLTKPFADAVNPEITKLADEAGVDLPLSAKTDSSFLKTAEAWSQKGLFGGKLRNQINNAYTKLDDLAEDLTLKAVGTTDLRGTGEAIKKGFSQFQDEFQKQKTTLYDSVSSEVMGAQVTAESTLQALDDIIKQKSQSLTGGSNVDFYKALQERIKSGNVTLDQIKATRSEVGSKLRGTDPLVTGDRATMNKLYASLSDDLDNGIRAVDATAGEALDKANAFYKSNIEKINSTVGRKILNTDPEKLVESIVKPNSETAVESLKSVIGEEAFSQVQETFFNRLFEKSLNPKTGRLDATKLQKQLSSYGDGTIKKLLSSEQQERLTTITEQLNKLDRLEKALKSGTKAADGSQTAFLGEVAGMTGIALVNPAVLAQYLVGRFAASQLFSTEFGRNLITGGVDLGTKPANLLQKTVPPAKVAKGVRAMPNNEQNDRFEALRRSQQNTNNVYQQSAKLLP